MAEPINYLAQMPQVNLGERLLRGLQIGAGFAQIQEQQAAKQQAEQRLQSYRTELESAFNQGTPKAFSRLMTMFPEHQAAIKPTFEQLGKERQEGEIAAALPVASALLSGNSKVAKDLIEARIQATPEGQDASGLKALSSLIDADPATAKNYTLMGLSQIMSPDKFAETFGKLAETSRAEQLAPSQLTESQAKAKTAAEKAKFAESEAALDLQKKGWDITKIQEDIKIAKQNSSIAALNAQIAKEGNVLKRQDLGMKLQEMTEKRDTSVREKAADLESARSNVDNMLNTAQRIISTPKSIIGAAAGPISARVPTISQDTADFEELVNTLGSQAFLAQLPNIKGMGALSNAEGEKLTAALQNFSLRQSPERLVENVKEATRLLNKARQNMTARSGFPESAPDIPAAPKQPIYAVNPQTGQRIMSVDGGNTWTQAR